MPPQEILGIRIPDSTIARAATELVRDTESELLFLHSMRGYGWGALAGRRKGLAFDPELLYVGAMFHDLGPAERFRESTLRFESTAPMRRASSCAATAYPSRTSTRSGARSRSIPPPASRSSCMRKPRCCMSPPAWMSPAARTTSPPTRSATR